MSDTLDLATGYLEAEERANAMPTLFDLTDDAA